MTWQANLGATAAGKSVGVYVSAKGGDGSWGAWTRQTGRTADASGTGSLQPPRARVGLAERPVQRRRPVVRQGDPGPLAVASRAWPRGRRSTDSQPDNAPGRDTSCIVRRNLRSACEGAMRPIADHRPASAAPRRRPSSRLRVALMIGLLVSAAAPASATAAPTAPLAISASTTVMTWGDTVVLKMAFGAIGANRLLVLQASRDALAWENIYTLTTDAGGNTSWPYRPATNLYYRAVFQGAPDLERHGQQRGPRGRGPPDRHPEADFQPARRPSSTPGSRSPSRCPFGHRDPSSCGPPSRSRSTGWLAASGSEFTTRDIPVDRLRQLPAPRGRSATRGEWYVRAIANPTRTTPTARGAGSNATASDEAFVPTGGYSRRSGSRAPLVSVPVARGCSRSAPKPWPQDRGASGERHHTLIALGNGAADDAASSATADRQRRFEPAGEGPRERRGQVVVVALDDRVRRPPPGMDRPGRWRRTGRRPSRSTAAAAARSRTSFCRPNASIRDVAQRVMSSGCCDRQTGTSNARRGRVADDRDRARDLVEQPRHRLALALEVACRALIVGGQPPIRRDDGQVGLRLDQPLDDLRAPAFAFGVLALEDRRVDRQVDEDA